MELINTEIAESSAVQTDYEGCLSYPGYIGKVRRTETIKIKYVNRSGENKLIERNGKMVRCIQREIDHLHGILFIDKVKEDHLIHSETETETSIEFLRELANKNS